MDSFPSIIGAAVSNSEPYKSTPPSGRSLAASASGYPSQPWLLEQTLCWAQGASFHSTFYMFSSYSCINLHSAVYASGRTASHRNRQLAGGSPEGHPENYSPPLAPSNSSATICDKA